MPNIYVLNKFQDNPYPHAVEVDTTSRGPFKDLSPFYLGPVVDPFYGDKCLVMENYWQYSKVYWEHWHTPGGIKDEYWEWRREGFNNPRANRYPMGKGKKPLGLLQGDEIIDYIPSRRRVYAPIYADLVKRTPSYAKLYQWAINEGRDLVLRDFDGYDYHTANMSLLEVIHAPNRKMGHAFILAGMLTGQLEYML